MLRMLATLIAPDAGHATIDGATSSPSARRSGNGSACFPTRAASTRA
jgi:ABC-type Na+ transport system ATPase subunit NatA